MKIELTERQVSQTIQEGLRALGYDVISTSVRGWSPGMKKGYGVTKGLADLLVGRKEWGPCLMPLEVKGPKTRLSPEQAELFDSGRLYVARSWEGAVEAVGNFEERYGFAQVARRVS